MKMKLSLDFPPFPSLVTPERRPRFLVGGSAPVLRKARGWQLRVARDAARPQPGPKSERTRIASSPRRNPQPPPQTAWRSRFDLTSLPSRPAKKIPGVDSRCGQTILPYPGRAKVHRRTRRVTRCSAISGAATTACWSSPSEPARRDPRSAPDKKLVPAAPPRAARRCPVTVFSILDSRRSASLPRSDNIPREQARCLRPNTRKLYTFGFAARRPGSAAGAFAASGSVNQNVLPRRLRCRRRFFRRVLHASLQNSTPGRCLSLLLVFDLADFFEIF